MSVSIHDLFSMLAEHERKYNASFSLIPSENALSPLARTAFLSDAFSRYFFDEHASFGRWSFQGGSIAGQIQTDIVVPVLKKIGKAEFVNVHAVSGLTGMTLALAAFGGPPGGTVVSVPPAYGGHPDTSYVADKLGYRVEKLPFTDWRSADIEALARLVARTRPALVYIDHATALYPLDFKAVIGAVRDANGNRTHVHVDTSHVNGLVWGGVLDNPLDCGADSYGGSTHKTFPGPHKAVLLTNSPELDERLVLTAVDMVSHHHLASVVALGIALLEFTECGGTEYAQRTVRNARFFARSLAAHGVQVEGGGPDYTRTHQVWVRAAQDPGAYALGQSMFEAGLIVNPFNPIPSIGAPGIRMGVNEITRLGLGEDAIETLAAAFGRVVADPVGAPGIVAGELAELREAYQPEYCYRGEVARDALSPFLATVRDERRQYLRQPSGMLQPDLASAR